MRPIRSIAIDRWEKSTWLIIVIVGAVGIFLLGKVYALEMTMLVIPLFPVEADKGISFYLDFVELCLAEFLWLVFFGCVVWLVYYLKVNRTIALRLEGTSLNKHWGIQVGLVTVICFFVILYVANFILDQFPNSADEYAYLFQAETISQGKLWHEPAKIEGAFDFNHIAQKDGARIGRFPPGWPLMLSISYVVGLPPWIVNPLLAIVTLVVFFFFARRLYGTTIAWWSLLALASTGYFIYNAASFFSHTFCLLVTLLFTWSAYAYFKDRKPAYAIAAGLMLGVLIIIRYFTAVLICIPLALYILYQFRLRSAVVGAFILAGTLPGVAFLFWYNYQITGDPLLPVTVWAYEGEGLGFVRGHSVVKGIEHTVRRIFLFIYWCSPGLLILYIAFLFTKLRSSVARWTHPEDYFFLVLLVGHFFYYQIGGNQYGPRFLFEALPFVILFVVRNVFESRKFAFKAVMIGCLIFPLIKLPFISHREATIVEQRMDMYDLVEEQNITNAVVFVSSPTSPIRPMPIEDLVRNDPYFKGDVIFVRGLPEYFKSVIDHYEGRSFYQYRRHVDSPAGELVKID